MQVDESLVTHEVDQEVYQEVDQEVDQEEEIVYEKEQEEQGIDQKEVDQIEEIDQTYQQDQVEEQVDRIDQEIDQQSVPVSISIPISKYDTLVLSAGSIKCLTTLGALQYAYDNYLLNIDTYIGTSSGAMICYFLAIGYTPVEILVYICTHQVLESLQDFNLFGLLKGKGAMSFSKIQEHLERMTINKIGYLPTLLDIKEKFNKTLIITTHNFTENRTEYLSHMTYPSLPCITALRMSANLPFIFDLYKYGNSFYIDGGISDTFSIDLGDSIGHKILGIYVESTITYEPESQYTVEYIYKLLNVPIIQIINRKISTISQKTRVLRLKSDNIKFLNFAIPSKDRLCMFSSGYEQFKSMIES